MANPNKHIRKAISDAVNETYPCFDTQVTGNKNPNKYVIISTQDKIDDKATKCGNRWIVATLIDIVCIYNGAGNVGSRVEVNDMTETIRALIGNISVDGYNVLIRTYEYPSDLDSSSATQTVYRNFIRLVLTLE